MADIALRDRNGNLVQYPGIETVKLNTADGKTVEFVDPALIPEILENVQIVPDFSGGNHIVALPEGVVAQSAVIEKPASLTPGNIAEGVEIAGIVGTMAAGGGGPGVQYTCDSSGYITAAKFTGLEFLPTRLFYYHSYLVSVDLSESPNLTGIGRDAFNSCTRFTSIELPDGLASIDGDAFAKCSKLEAIALPDSVTSIGTWVFNKCTALKSCKLSAGLTSLGDGTFYGCSALTEIVIPKSVTKIGINAFLNCTALTSAVFEGSKDWRYGNSMGSMLGTVNMSDPAAAAEYLRSTYASRYLWC